ncbi:hypothetical protein Tco_1293994 [Tanacetum coccineum]
MEQESLQQASLYEALVPIADQVKIGSYNMRIDPIKTQKEATYQLVLDILKRSSCYNAFLIKADVSQIYMKEDFPLPIEQPYIAVQRDVNRCPIPDSPRSSSITSSLNSIPKRHSSFINTIKYDLILGKLKFVSKGEKIANPDEALKLGKSISLTEVEEKEEERRLHETHSRLVIEKAADDVDSEETKDEADDRVIQRRPTGVIIGGPVRKVFDEEKLDHSQKLKAESKKAVVEEKQADDQEKAADEEKADKEINDAEKDENEKT